MYRAPSCDKKYFPETVIADTQILPCETWVLNCSYPVHINNSFDYFFVSNPISSENYSFFFQINPIF